MDCSLWLNRKKINSAAQISDNLDVASLRGYFLAGSLIEWLEEHGGEKYAASLSKLSHDDPALNEKIVGIFNGNPLPVKQLDGTSPKKNTSAKVQNVSGVSGCVGSFKMPNSFKFTNSSFAAGSYSGSFEFGSFLAYLSGRFGSFNITSFFGTSFSEWEWEWLWEYLRGYSSGSFVSSSFSLTSFPMTSFSQWERFYEIFGDFSGDWSSFTGTIPFGMDEYDFIMFKTLMICPLDRFGYGIHII
ncbi:MAG: hypothetical protein ACI4JS_01360 [Oscillospiraceae bacterium]